MKCSEETLLLTPHTAAKGSVLNKKFADLCAVLDYADLDDMQREVDELPKHGDHVTVARLVGRVIQAARDVHPILLTLREAMRNETPPKEEAHHETRG